MNMSCGWYGNPWNTSAVNPYRKYKSKNEEIRHSMTNTRSQGDDSEQVKPNLSRQHSEPVIKSGRGKLTVYDNLPSSSAVESLQTPFPRGTNFNATYESTSGNGRYSDLPPDSVKSLRQASIGQLELEKQRQRLQPALLYQLMGGGMSVTNAGSGGMNEFRHVSSGTFKFAGNVADNASLRSIGPEEQIRRLSLLRGLRTQKLIGRYKKVANWMEHWKPGVKKIKNKATRKYYEEQNELIERFEEIDNLLDTGRIHYNLISSYNYSDEENDPNFFDAATSGIKSTEMMKNINSTNSKHSRTHNKPSQIVLESAQFLGYDKDQEEKQIYIAIIVNFITNFILLLGKAVVCLLTNSMSIIASLVDSILDFLSTFIIYFANKISQSKNSHIQNSYPVGRTRLEPLGILVFSVIIIVSFFQVGQESLKRLIWPSDNRIPSEVSRDASLIMIITILAKVLTWLWCMKSNSSSVRALAQDALSDIIFNTFSLLLPTLGFYLNLWWLDPLGATFLSAYIIITWSITAFEHIDNLTGSAASTLNYKVILYLSYRFAESIKQITALKVYHVGDNLNVEIDVVFNDIDYNMTFKETHDIAETLQYAIESLPMVERAFVHIDYMQGNYKGHLQ